MAYWAPLPQHRLRRPLQLLPRLHQHVDMDRGWHSAPAIQFASLQGFGVCRLKARHAQLGEVLTHLRQLLGREHLIRAEVRAVGHCLCLFFAIKCSASYVGWQRDFNRWHGQLVLCSPDPMCPERQDLLEVLRVASARVPKANGTLQTTIILRHQSLGRNVAELTPFTADCSRNPSPDLWITEASI